MKRFVEFITLQTLVIAVIAVGATWLFWYYDLGADIPTSLMGIAVIFPIVFAINAAFRRRERSLGWLADMKGAAMSLFFAYRDWVPRAKSRDDRKRLEHAIETLAKTMTNVTGYLSDPDQHKRANLDEIYDGFSAVSLLHEEGRSLGLAGGEISRANQYLTHIIRDFEKIATIKEYRTPLSLRGYWQIFLNLFPILFAPSFANLAAKTHPAIGFGTAILYTLVLVGLDNIQEKLEDPFDQDSIDDIRLDFVAGYERCMKGLTDRRIASPDA